MFGISGEHLLILGIILLIFGPKRLPELGNTLGKALKNFRDGMGGVEEARFRRIEEEKQRARSSDPDKTQPAPAEAVVSHESGDPSDQPPRTGS